MTSPRAMNNLMLTWRHHTPPFRLKTYIFKPRGDGKGDMKPFAIIYDDAIRFVHPRCFYLFLLFDWLISICFLIGSLQCAFWLACSNCSAWVWFAKSVVVLISIVQVLAIYNTWLVGKFFDNRHKALKLISNFKINVLITVLIRYYFNFHYSAYSLRQEEVDDVIWGGAEIDDVMVTFFGLWVVSPVHLTCSLIGLFKLLSAVIG